VGIDANLGTGGRGPSSQSEAPDWDNGPAFRIASFERIGSLLRAANARNAVDVEVVNRQWNEIPENLHRRAVHNKVAVNESIRVSLEVTYGDWEKTARYVLLT